MFPVGDDNPTIRTPIVTYATLAIIFAVWLIVQGGGGATGSQMQLIASVCNLGLVPAELTQLRPVGYAVPLDAAGTLACVVDAESINWLTPITSMFLHGGWGHIISNSLFLWVFGNNVEDSMGRMRFTVFYLVCGLAAAAAHVLIDPASAIPTVGASGAISQGVMGRLPGASTRRRRCGFTLPVPSYLFRIYAWLVLLYWFRPAAALGLPELMQVRTEASGGVAGMGARGRLLVARRSHR
jgi:membrane associated rhomboid family serine protease